MYRELRMLEDREDVRSVIAQAYDIVERVVEELLELDLSDFVEERDGYFSQSHHIEHELEEGESVTVPYSYGYNEDFYEYSIRTVTIVPLLRRMCSIELARARPFQCAKCTLQDCSRCSGGKVTVAYVLIVSSEGRYFREFYGHYYSSRTCAYIVSTEPITVRHVTYPPATSDPPSMFELEEVDIYPITSEVKIKPMPDLYMQVRQLYEKAIKIASDLERLLKLVRKLVPTGDIVWLAEEEENKQS